jgi:hypothetical protein
VELEWFMEEAREFIVGVDLGQAHDPTAIAVIEHVWVQVHQAYRGRVDGDQLRAWREAIRAHRPQYNVRWADRLPLGMHYPAQVAHIAEMVRRDPLKDARVFYDYTGVGRPVGDLLHDARIRNLNRVHLTGGQDSKVDGDRHALSKVDLVSRLQAALHSDELAIEETLPLAATLARELADDRLDFTAAGNAQFNARSGAHDDLLIATGLALYGAQRARLATRIDLRFAC